MKMHVHLTLLTFVMLAATTDSSAQPPVVPPPSDNAAVWYLTAQMELASHADVINKTFSNWETPDLDAVKQAPVDFATPLTYIRRGAQLDRCVWAVDIQKDGIVTLLPHLSMMRQFGRILTVDAQVRFRDGDNTGAVDDLLAVRRIARHTAADGTLIACLVQFSIESMAVKTLAKSLDRLDREELLSLREQLGQQPGRVTVADAIAVERSLIWWFKKLVDEKGLEATVTQMREALGEGPGVDKKPEPFTAPSAEQFKIWFDEADAYYLKSYDLLKLPFPQFEEANTQLELQPLAAENLFLQMIPMFSKARRSQLRIEIDSAMLDAMIAYRLGGEDAFKQVVDPFDGKPFDREVTEKGVVVLSRFVFDQAPQSMTFPVSCAKPLK